MQDIAAILSLAGLSFLAGGIEYIEYGTFLTPYNVLVWPYMIVVLGVNLVGGCFGYYHISFESVLFVFWNSLIFWLAGQVVWTLTHPRRDIKKRLAANQYLKYQRIYHFILIIGLVAMVLSLVLAMRKETIGSEGFAKAYGWGFLGHIAIMGYPGIIFVIGEYFWTRKVRTLLVAVVSLGLMMLYLSKFRGITILLAGGYLFLGAKKNGTQSKLMVSLLGGVIFTFFGAYVISYVAMTNVSIAFSGQTLSLIAKHMMNYIVCAPIGLSHLMQSGIGVPVGWQSLLAAPINVFRLITGSNELVNIHLFDLVSISDSFSANVRTMFGVLYIAVGYSGSLLVMAVLGVGIYGVFATALRSSNIALKMLSAYLLATLSIGFFGYLFFLLTFWETVFYIIVFPAIIGLVKCLYSKEILTKEVSK